MPKENLNIKNEDWRLQAITTIAKEFISPYGEKSKIGTPVSMVTRINLHNKILFFRVPSICALFLDVADNCRNSVQENMGKDNFIDGNIKYTKGHICPKDEGAFFETIEMMMVHVVFSYTALESFANEIIPVDYVHKAERRDGKCVEVYNKEQIEREISLDIKLAEILPVITKVNSPKGGSLWNKYVELKRLRDRIIHKKTNDKISAGPDEESFWMDLLNEKNSNFATDAKNIIEYYYQSKEKPRWLTKYPY